MRTRVLAAAAALGFAVIPVRAFAQSARSAAAPSYSYSASFDSSDLRAIRVVIAFENFPDIFRLAAAVHPEYDNRYWRYLRELSATNSASAAGTVQRLDSTLWRVSVPGGRGRIEYSIQLQPEGNPDSRASWHPFARPTGALLTTIDALLYFPDFTRGGTRLDLTYPADWKLATGLERTGATEHVCGASTEASGRQCRSRAHLAARSVESLLDSPILLGDLHQWDFTVHRIPHHIYYWPLPNAKPFDTAAFATRVEGLAREVMAVFRRAPYSEYSFLFQDGAWGALQHYNSVAIGIPSADLASDVNSYLVEIAHEFFHAWNEMAIRPAGWGALSYKRTPPSSELWWTEGVTMYYAYLLPRRIGFPEEKHTRIQQLETDLGDYFDSPGNTRISPERASLLADADPWAAGDYDSNYFLVGRLIGEALELIVADSTRDAHGLDEVMRRVYAKHAGPRGFVGTDISNAVSTVCKCDAVPFFRDHVSGAKPLDFNRYLASLGLAVSLDTVAVTDSAGAALPDKRIWVRASPAGGRARLILFDPNTAWTRAGLHSGDELVSFNGARIDSLIDLRRALRPIKMNDVVPVEVMRGRTPHRVEVKVTGYTKVRAKIGERPGATRAQVARRERWLTGRLARDESMRAPGHPNKLGVSAH